MMKHQVKEYVTLDGKSPYREWLDSLDAQIKARIQVRIFRFELGNLGDHKSVGKGVWEARIQFGPGYRVYFGKEDGRIILLLFAGDKSTQSRDIKKAQTYWEEYLEGGSENG
jgi:putative addiction module killer protein